MKTRTWLVSESRAKDWAARRARSGSKLTSASSTTTGQWLGVFAELADEAEPQGQVELLTGASAQFLGPLAGPGGVGHRYGLLADGGKETLVPAAGHFGEELLGVSDDAGLPLLLELVPRPVQQRLGDGQA